MEQNQIDQELISNIKLKDCSDSLETLTNRHMGLFTKIVNGYAPAISNLTGICAQDLLSERYSIFYEAAKNYNDKKSKFSTHVANSTRFFCLKTIQTNKRGYTNINLETDYQDAIDKECFCENDVEDRDSQRSLEYILSYLKPFEDKRIYQVFQLRFSSFPLMTFDEISIQINLSKQGVINIFKKGMNFLKNHKNIQNLVDELEYFPYYSSKEQHKNK